MSLESEETQPVQKTKSYHHGNLYESLIVAGHKILEEKGMNGLSLREVAKSIGVSHTAPYRHFKDKNALMIAIAQKSYDDLGDYIVDKLQSSENGSLNQLQQFARSYIEFTLENRPFFKLMFSGVYQPNKAFQFTDSENSCFKVLQKLIEDGQSQGSLNPQGTPSIMALTLWTSIHGLAMLFASGQISNVEDKEPVLKLSSALVLQLVQGLKPAP